MKKYKPVAIDEVKAMHMVQAYEERMRQAVLHSTNPAVQPPVIHFASEKITWQVDKEFLEPFFDGRLVPGCAGISMLKCIDSNAEGKLFEALMLFGLDAAGKPLSGTQAYKFAGKAPGRLLPETGAVLNEYFSGGSNGTTLGLNMPPAPPKTIEDLARLPRHLGAMILNFTTARHIFKQFREKWAGLGGRLALPEGVSVTDMPDIPGTSQNLAFKIDISEVNEKILNPASHNLSKVACVICFNDRNSETVTTDDSLSIMLVGVGSSNTPVSDAAIEKWPNMFTVTAADEANFLSKVLNKGFPVFASDSDNTETAIKRAQAFAKAWNDMLEHTASPVVGSNRPGIEIDNQPVLYFMNPDVLRTMVTAAGTDGAIAGIFGIENNIMAPFFIPITVDDRPAGKVVFVDRQPGPIFSDSIALDKVRDTILGKDRL